MKKIMLFLVCSILYTGVLLNAQDAEIDEILSNIEQVKESIVSYKADIEMFFLKTESGPMQIEGQIAFKKPDKLKFVIWVKGEPNSNQGIYSDGTTLWQYMPFFKLASKVDLGLLKEEFPNADELVKEHSNIKGAVDDIDRESMIYDGIDEYEGEKVYLFEGKIKSKAQEEMDTPVAVDSLKVLISVADGLQRSAEFYSQGKELQFYQRLKNIEVNIEIPDEEFKFDAPEGVNILDSTPQAREMLKQATEESSE